MQEIKAFLRMERAQSVVVALRNAGVPRLTLSHMHSLGSGVDPEHYRLSFEEGSAFTEKVRLELVCRAQDVDRFVEIILREARTGHRGDGVVFISGVDRAVKIRNGDEGVLALL